MLKLFYKFFSDHNFQSFPSNSEDITEEKLHKLESFNEEVIESDILITILCSIGGKKGGDITGNFSDRERFDDFISILNSMGLNCFVDFNPTLTEAENMSNFLEEEISEDVKERLESAEVRARVFMTKDDSYEINFFRKLLFYRKFTARYHRLYGEFLGFPSENIDCFTFHQRNKLIQKILRFLGKGEPGKVSDWELADRYEEELSEREYKNLRAFVYSIYPDVDGSLDIALENAEKRKRLLEEYGIDADGYAEFFVDW